MTAALKERLAARGVDVAVLESDEVRKILTVHPRYDEEERDRFYAQMAWIGELLVRHGVPVIFDATANRRVYRNRVRQKIARFVEVFVDVPLETCMARDPKGIYRSGGAGGSATVPGLQAAYEAPEAAEVVVHEEMPGIAAERVVAKLDERGYLGTPP